MSCTWLGFLAVGLCVLAVPAACASFDAAEGENDASPPPDGGEGGESGESGPRCPASIAGPALVPISGFKPFCIDATEVSQAQYNTWTTRSLASLPAGCSWKTKFKDEPSNEPLSPALFLDWCDAYAFCQFAGKRLCTQEELKFACSGGDGRRLPYGDVFDASACNVGEKALGASWPVGSRASCGGGFTGVFDLVGNADEWTGSCESGADAGNDQTMCRVYGGWYESRGVTCNSTEMHTRGSNAGFRCCAP